jgi:oligopeptide transport system substrate-binding protein
MRKLTILALLILSSVAVSCQVSPSVTPSPYPSPTVTPYPSPTVTPYSAPTFQPTPPVTTTPDFVPSNVPDPAIVDGTGTFSLILYLNETFGIEIGYPDEWKLVETGLGTPLIYILGPSDDLPRTQLHVFYLETLLDPGQAADTMIPELYDLPSFRVLDEKEIDLDDGTVGFQVNYQWRTEEGMNQGRFMVTTRGSQSIVVHTVGPETTVISQTEKLDAMVKSLHLYESKPLGVAREDALTLYFDNGPITLDPAIAQEQQSIQYVLQLFSGLVSFQAGLELTNELAAEWSITGNGTVYTFKIREDARFHNGRNVSAADVKYAWERAVDPTLNSPTARTYLGDIVGVEEMINGIADAISGIKVLDQHTLRVTIDQPKSYFISKLVHPVTFVVDRENTEGRSVPGLPWWTDPNGTGPFRLKGWDPGIVLVMEANELFYLEPPKVPHVVFRLYGGDPLLMYLAGEIDIAHVRDSEVRDLKNSNEPFSEHLRKFPRLDVFYVGFVSSRPPFDDPKVRKAFLLAADREKLLASAIDRGAILANGFLPPGLPGYKIRPPIKFDPQEARKLLGESKYGGPSGLPPIIYTTPGQTNPSDIVMDLVEMWSANLGVNVQVRLVEQSQYYYGLDRIVDNIFDYGWIADYPDPQNFLDVLFYSTADNNVGGYSSQAVDGLLEQARLVESNSARYAAYRQVEEILVGDAAAIPLRFGSMHMLVQPYLHGFFINPLGMAALRTVYIKAG